MWTACYKIRSVNARRDFIPYIFFLKMKICLHFMPIAHRGMVVSIWENNKLMVMMIMIMMMITIIIIIIIIFINCNCVFTLWQWFFLRAYRIWNRYIAMLYCCENDAIYIYIYMYIYIYINVIYGKKYIVSEFYNN